MEENKFDFDKYQIEASTFTENKSSIWDPAAESTASQSFSDLKNVFDFENALKSSTIKAGVSFTKERRLIPELAEVV
tara:strand:+ start:99 stop:329 length:231 start_codon:yes stop_codon:yes gene_type:complete